MEGSHGGTLADEVVVRLHAGPFMSTRVNQLQLLGRQECAGATSTTTVTGPAWADTVCAEPGVQAKVQNDSAKAAHKRTDGWTMVHAYFLIVSSS